MAPRFCLYNEAASVPGISLWGRRSQITDSMLNPTVLPRTVARWTLAAPVPTRRPDRVQAW
jgi:hypothetical protein